jgi:1,4-dihydroxy-2-naphthoate octaprenyltransferase
MMRALAAFARLSRPLFLYGGLAGVALGASLAAWRGHVVDRPTYVWIQLMVTAFQLMVHYANDYFDRDGDRNATRTAWSGGSGILADGTLPPSVGSIAAAIAGALGAVAVLRFFAGGNSAAAGLGCAMGVLSWAYSAPPLRLAARGLGELDAAAVVAVLVPAAAYAAFAGELQAAIAPPLVATAITMMAMMLCVEIPDAGSDRASGKGTLVVRLGPSNALNLLMLAVSGGLAATIVVLVGLRSLGGIAAGAALVPGVALILLVRGDPRPASVAFWGVALYGTTVTALAIAYATAGHP